MNTQQPPIATDTAIPARDTHRRGTNITQFFLIIRLDVDDMNNRRDNRDYSQSSRKTSGEP